MCIASMAPVADPLNVNIWGGGSGSIWDGGGVGLRNQGRVLASAQGGTRVQKRIGHVLTTPQSDKRKTAKPPNHSERIRMRRFESPTARLMPRAPFQGCHSHEADVSHAKVLTTQKAEATYVADRVKTHQDFAKRTANSTATFTCHQHSKPAGPTPPCLILVQQWTAKLRQ